MKRRSSQESFDSASESESVLHPSSSKCLGIQAVHQAIAWQSAAASSGLWWTAGGFPNNYFCGEKRPYGRARRSAIFAGWAQMEEVKAVLVGALRTKLAAGRDGIDYQISTLHRVSDEAKALVITDPQEQIDKHSSWNWSLHHSTTEQGEVKKAFDGCWLQGLTRKTDTTRKPLGNHAQTTRKPLGKK